MTNFPRDHTKLTLVLIVLVAGAAIFLALPAPNSAQDRGTQSNSFSIKRAAESAPESTPESVTPGGTGTFYKDVLPILQAHCQDCHRPGEIGPMPLLTYEQTRRWSKAIEQAVESKKMPPWFGDPQFGRFANDPSLSDEEIETLARWAEENAPAGNAGDAPPARQWTAGWNIPTPDAVVRMPKPVLLPARGDVEYTYEIVPTNFTEDKWVQILGDPAAAPRKCASRRGLCSAARLAVAAACPGRHAFHRLDSENEQDRRDAEFTTSDILLVYAPGSSPDQWPQGMAKFIPRGSDLVFQMHYVTRGRQAADQTSIG